MNELKAVSTEELALVDGGTWFDVVADYGGAIVLGPLGAAVVTGMALAAAAALKSAK